MYCRPDIVHAHDWPTAPVAFGDLGGECKSIFTIHNLNYGQDLIGRAMEVAAAGTTVSPTYAAEVASTLMSCIPSPISSHCVDESFTTGMQSMLYVASEMVVSTLCHQLMMCHDDKCLSTRHFEYFVAENPLLLLMQGASSGTSDHCAAHACIMQHSASLRQAFPLQFRKEYPVVCR